MNQPDKTASIRLLPERPEVVVASPQETVEAILNKSARRGFVPIRRAFVQGGKQKQPTPGPLASLVSGHGHRALDLYLLVVAWASSEPWQVNQPAALWARALGLPPNPSSLGSVSKTFRRLEDLGLIERARDGKRLSVTLLREDGKGDPYTHPGEKRERYLRIPFAYWDADERWHSRLDMPAKAMLLIALSLSPGFYLQYENAPRWYGVSADTAAKGLNSLETHGLIRSWHEEVKAPLAPDGYALRKRYHLNDPFDLHKTATIKPIKIDYGSA